MEKCFNFEAVVTTKIKGYVWASNEEQARQLIEARKWDEADYLNADAEVEEVLDIRQDNKND